MQHMYHRRRCATSLRIGRDNEENSRREGIGLGGQKKQPGKGVFGSSPCILS